MGLSLAFTGTGYISKIHAKAAQKVQDVALVAVVNHRSESMAEFAQQFNIARQYTHVEALLKNGNVDALVVSTPNALHATETIAALERGVHVLVEKPMAMDSGECEAMLEASEKSGARLMVAHCWRFHEEVIWLKQRVQTGMLGKIIRSKGYGVHVNWGPTGWFTQKQFAGGGAMADMGVHAIDTVRFMLGDPQPISVYAQIGTYYGDYEVDDTGVLLVTWEGGAVSYIESGWWQPHSDSTEAGTQLYGTRGFGQVFPTGLKVPVPLEGRVEEIPGPFSTPDHARLVEKMYEAQMAYFIRCICEGSTPIPGGAEGLVNMRVVDAAYESARSGKVIEF